MKKMIVLLSLLLAPLMATAEPVQTMDMGSDAHYGRDQFGQFDFGTTFVGNRRSVDFVVSAGQFPLEMQGMNVLGRWFAADTNCPRIIFPGQRCIVRAYYWPRQTGRHFGELVVYFNSGRAVVRLYGAAIR